MNQNEKNKIFDEAEIKLTDAREKINRELVSISEKGKKRLENLTGNFNVNWESRFIKVSNTL